MVDIGNFWAYFLDSLVVMVPIALVLGFLSIKVFGTSWKLWRKLLLFQKTKKVTGEKIRYKDTRSMPSYMKPYVVGITFKTKNNVITEVTVSKNKKLVYRATRRFRFFPRVETYRRDTEGWEAVFEIALLKVLQMKIPKAYDHIKVEN